VAEAAAIVLCGGRSRRMGRDKATLPFGPESMLERVVRLVSEVVGEVWVVAREGQEIAGEYNVARDSAAGRGPLAGLAAGLGAMAAERAFLCACDAPLLRPALVERLLELSEGREACVPRIDGHYMVTTAVYSRALLPLAERLLAEDRLRPLHLVEACDARIVGAPELRDVDPELDSLRDCNSPEAYQAALERAGLSAAGASEPSS
jgi:molybdopterin-guanine dinucleotide biosynthesis protein A